MHESRALFTAVKLGDHAATQEVDRIIRQFALQLGRCARPAGASDIDWEDVAQEVSRRFFTRGIDQYSGRGSERSYLYSMTKSVALQMYRSTRRRLQREEAVEVAAVSPPVDPSARVDVHKILSRLDEACRRLLERVFLYAESYQDLSAELGMAESSVRSKVSRCVRRAREHAQ